LGGLGCATAFGIIPVLAQAVAVLSDSGFLLDAKNQTLIGDEISRRRPRCGLGGSPCFLENLKCPCTARWRL